MDTDEVWKSSVTNGGSVQHLEFLDDWTKDVFKTAVEIDQPENNVILDYDSLADLTGYPGGVYKINGLSYLLDDSLDIPLPNGSLTLSGLNNDLESSSPDFCGAVTDTCLTISIIEIGKKNNAE